MTSATPQTQFPQPHEIEGSWDWDKIHAPRPLTPQAGDAIIMAMGEGFTIAQHDFGSTLELRCRMVNNYFYAAFVPDPNYTPPTTDIEEYSRQLDKISAKIGERWKTEWEPSLLPILEWARRTVMLVGWPGWRRAAMRSRSAVLVTGRPDNSMTTSVARTPALSAGLSERTEPT